jgi:hypothetical protein
MKKNVAEANSYDYSLINSLKKFGGEHPKVMEERLRRMNWDFHFDTSKKKFSFRDWLLYGFERLTGIRPFEYRNYTMLK